MISRFPKPGNRKSGHKRLEAQLGRLFNYAQYLARNRETARDLVQSCAVKAVAAKNVPGDEPAYRAWLFKILRNIFLDSLRKQAVDGALLRDLAGNTVLGWNNQQDPSVYRIEQRKINILAVREGLAKLKASQREIIVLVDIVGFSYRETSDLLAVPIGTVMSRLSRARNALMREMDGISVGPVSVTSIGKSK